MGFTFHATPKAGWGKPRRAASSSSEYSSSTNSNTSSENREPEPESVPASPRVEESNEPFFEDDEDVPRDEPRGKKGLTHQEMALAGYSSDPEPGESTQSESDDDQRERNHPREEQVETEREDDDDDHDHPEQRGKRMQWVEPLVAQAADLLEEKGLETNAIGYAKLMSAGKGTVDFPVRFQSVTIGRVGFGSDCELKSEGRFVSRQHARLYWEEKCDRWHITCLSKNGLLVDGTPVVPSAAPMPLSSRSLIEIGDVAFFFLKATGSLFRVNDIELLEKKIMDARSMHDEYSEDDGYNEDFLTDENGPYKISNGVKVRLKKQSRPGTGRLEKRPSSKKGARSAGSNGPGSGKKAKGKGNGKKGATPSESDFTTSESESEEEEEEIPDILDDIKYKPMLVPLPSMNGKRKHGGDRSDGKKRRRKARSSHADSSADEHESGIGHDDWTKKEKADFARALFAVGVDPIHENGTLTHFSWERFRGIAELQNKTDYELEAYYRRFMTDVHTLLEDEEREKRTKGPRTKHKKGCDCIVCLNTAKSRERKRASSGFEDRGGGSEDDRETKSTGKPNDKLVGLVTAQKLRVRMGIHESALQVARDTVQADAVFQKLNATRGTVELKDFPKWWIVGYHDKALMKGVHKHGVGNWDNIWYDDNLSRFMRIREKDGVMAVWPSQQAVMKRVRDISNLITSEMKRIAKKEREMRKYAKRKAKRTEKRRQRERMRGGSVNEVQAPQREADVSTAEESGSEGERPPAEEGESDDEDNVEVEVEEMEVEDAEDAQSYDGDNDGESGPARSGVVAAADDTTDEEGDAEGNGDEEIVEYETESESGSD